MMIGDLTSDVVALANQAGLVPKAVISLPSMPWAGVYILDPTQPAASASWLPTVDVSLRDPTAQDLAAPNLMTTLEIVGAVLLGLAVYGGWRLVRG